MTTHPNQSFAALRKGDEAVFAQLVDQHTPSLLRVARGPDEEWPGDWKDWKEYPGAFPETREGSVLSDELTAVARAELDRLPERQRVVVTMRDMLGFDSSEV